MTGNFGSFTYIDEQNSMHIIWHPPTARTFILTLTQGSVLLSLFVNNVYGSLVLWYSHTVTKDQH